MKKRSLKQTKNQMNELLKIAVCLTDGIVQGQIATVLLVLFVHELWLFACKGKS
jgi:hypothetical protein